MRDLFRFFVNIIRKFGSSRSMIYRATYVFVCACAREKIFEREREREREREKAEHN